MPGADHDVRTSEEEGTEMSETDGLEAGAPAAPAAPQARGKIPQRLRIRRVSLKHASPE